MRGEGVWPREGRITGKRREQLQIVEGESEGRAEREVSESDTANGTEKGKRTEKLQEAGR